MFVEHQLKIFLIGLPNKLRKIFYCQVYLKCSSSWWQVDQIPWNGLRVWGGHREDWVRNGDKVTTATIESDGLGGLRGECIVLGWTIRKLVGPLKVRD